MKVLKLCLLFLAVSLFAGCLTTTSTLCEPPNNETSVICVLSEKMNITPEILSQTLLIANLGAIEGDLYSAQEGMEFLDKLIEEIGDVKDLGNEVTYIEAIQYIDSKFKVLPDRVKIIFVIINPAGLTSNTITIPLSNHDWNMIMEHLYKQRSILQLYL